MDVEVVAVLIPLASIIGGLTVGALAMRHRARLRELVYRERIAMIERGLVPSPEVDPARFDQIMEQGWKSSLTSPDRANRQRTAGIILIGVGLALTVLITFAGDEPRVAVGVGGALVMLGGAFLVSSHLGRDRRVPPQSAYGDRMDEAPPPAPPATP